MMTIKIVSPAVLFIIFHRPKNTEAFTFTSFSSSSSKSPFVGFVPGARIPTFTCLSRKAKVDDDENDDELIVDRLTKEILNEVHRAVDEDSVRTVTNEANNLSRSDELNHFFDCADTIDQEFNNTLDENNTKIKIHESNETVAEVDFLEEQFASNSISFVTEMQEIIKGGALDAGGVHAPYDVRDTTEFAPTIASDNLSQDTFDAVEAVADIENDAPRFLDRSSYESVEEEDSIGISQREPMSLYFVEIEDEDPIPSVEDQAVDEQDDIQDETREIAETLVQDVVTGEEMYDGHDTVDFTTVPASEVLYEGFDATDANAGFATNGIEADCRSTFESEVDLEQFIDFQREAISQNSNVTMEGENLPDYQPSRATEMYESVATQGNGGKLDSLDSVATEAPYDSPSAHKITKAEQDVEDRTCTAVSSTAYSLKDTLSDVSSTLQRTSEQPQLTQPVDTPKFDLISDSEGNFEVTAQGNVEESELPTMDETVETITSDELAQIEENRRIVSMLLEDIHEANWRKVNAELNISELTKQVAEIELALEEKRNELNSDKDAWEAEKGSLEARVLELDKLLELNDAKAKDNEAVVQMESKQSQDILAIEIEQFNLTLEQTLQALQKEQDIATEVRSRLADAERKYALEQVEHEKQKQRLVAQRQEQKRKLKQLETQLEEEKHRFEAERIVREAMIDDNTIKISQSEDQLLLLRTQFREEELDLKQSISQQLAEIPLLQAKLELEQESYSAERSELEKTLDESKIKLEATKERLTRSEEEFERALQDMEMTIVFGMTKVKQLLIDLESETERFSRNNSLMECTLAEERAKLAEAESQLEWLKSNVMNESNVLYNKVEAGQKARIQQAKEMKILYDDTRISMASMIHAEKRAARKEHAVLLKQHEERIAVASESLVRLESDLKGAKLAFSEVQGDLRSKELEVQNARVNRDRLEAIYVTAISGGDVVISKLQNDINQLQNDVANQDKRLTPSIRELLGLSVKLSYTRLQKAGSKVFNFFRHRWS